MPFSASVSGSSITVIGTIVSAGNYNVHLFGPTEQNGILAIYNESYGQNGGTGSSYTTFPNLTDGTYTISIDGNPLPGSYIVDTTPPPMPTLSLTNLTTGPTQTSAYISIQAEVGSTITLYYSKYNFDTTSWGNYENTTAVATGDEQQIPIDTLDPSSVYRFYATASDSRGNGSASTAEYTTTPAPKEVLGITADVALGTQVTVGLTCSDTLMESDLIMIFLLTGDNFDIYIAHEVINPSQLPYVFTADDVDIPYGVYKAAAGYAPAGMFPTVFVSSDEFTLEPFPMLAAPVLDDIYVPNMEAGALTVVFTPVADANDYLVEYSSNETDWYTATTVQFTSGNVKITGLPQGEVSYIRMTAMANPETHSNSNISNVLSLRTLAALERPATSVLQDTGSLTVTWPPVAHATGYTLKYKLASASSSPWVDATVTAPVSPDVNYSALLTGLSPGQTYSIELTVVGDNVYASRVATLSGTTLAVKLNAPTNVVLAAGSAPSTFRLTWGPVTNAASYKIQYYRTTGSPGWRDIYSAETSPFEFIPTNLIQQSFRVIAVPATGSTAYLISDPTESNSATPAIAQLATPSVVLDKGPSDLTLTASWGLIMSADKYEIGYSTNNGSTFTLLSSDVTGTSYTFTVSTAVPIIVRVKALALAGSTVYSDSSYGQSSSNTPNDSTSTMFNTPGMVTLTPGATLLSLSVSWDAVAGATIYKIEYSENDVDWIVASSATANNPYAFTVPTAAPRKVRVTAVPVYGQSYRASNAGESEFVAPDIPLDTPTGVTVAASTTPLLAIASWVHVSNADTYMLEASDDQDSWQIVGENISSNSFTFFTTLSPVYIRVTAIAASGSGYIDSDPAESTSSATPGTGPSNIPRMANIAKAIYNSSYPDKRAALKDIISNDGIVNGGTFGKVAGVAGALSVSNFLSLMQLSGINAAAYNAVYMMSVDSTSSVTIALEDMSTPAIIYMVTDGDYYFTEGGITVNRIVVDSSSNPKYSIYDSQGNPLPTPTDGYFTLGTKRFNYLADGSVVGGLTVAPQKLPTPSGLTNAPTGGAYNSLTVSWVALNSTTYPNVEYILEKTSNGTVWTNALSTPTTSQTSINISTTVALRVRVKATDGYNDESDFNTSSGAVSPTPSPKAYTATAGSSNTATLAAVDGTRPSSISVSYATSPFSNYTTFTYSNGVVTFNGLSAGTYSFNIVSLDAGFESSPRSVSITISNNAAAGSPPGNAVCFLADAPVLTPVGYRPIASIKEGELVRTAAGRDVVVKRVFRKQYEAGPTVNPYVIPKGSFGALRALPISPNHEVMTAKGMVQAKELGLPRMKMAGRFVYYNLELEDWVRDNLVVAGVECESLAPATRITMTKAEFTRFVMALYQPSALTRLRTVCFEEADGRVSMPALR